MNGPHDRKFLWRPLAVFLGFTVVVAGAGYLFFAQITRSAKANAAAELTSIGQLKAEQIRYYLERYDRNARSMAGLLGQGGLTAWLGRSTAEVPSSWRRALQETMQSRDDDGLLVLDLNGQVRLGVGRHARITAEGRRLALRAARDTATVTSDIYYGDPDGPAQALLDIFVPIMDRTRARARAAGVLVLRNNLVYLDSLIQSWPVESRSGESVLVRRDGTDALFLNELRFRQQTTLRMRVPLSANRDDPAWPATAAVQGDTGVWEARDYRGQPVLAYTLSVPTTTWGMVVKMDLDEVLAPVRNLRTSSIGVATAFILLALLALLTWQRATRAELDREVAAGEERLRLLTNAVKDYAIVMLDTQGLVVTWNDGAQRLKGYAAAEILGQSMERFYTAEDLAAGTPARLLAVASTEGRVESEGWRVRKDGTRFFADVVITAMRGASGTAAGFAKFTRDISDRRDAQLKAQALKERAEALLEAAPDATVIVDGAGRIAIVNARTEVIFGYSRAELVGQPVELLIPPHLHARHVAQRVSYQQAPVARAMGANRELTARRKDGSEFPVDVSLSPLDTPDGMLIISSVRDVTERRRAERALSEQRAFLRQVIDLDRNFIFTKDREGRFTLANDALAAAYGTTVNDLIGKTDHDFNPHVEEVEHFRRDDLEVMDSLREKVIPEESITGADGRVRWLQTVKRPIIGPDGRAHLILGVATDFTERKLAEQATRASQEQYRALFNSLLEGFCIIEVIFDDAGRPVDYRFLETNSAFESQTGLRNAQGMRMRELAPNHEEHWFRIYGDIATTGVPAHFVNEAKQLNRWHEVSAYRVGGPGSRKVAVLFNDISDLKRSEQKVLGQLAHLNLLDQITRSIGERQDLSSIYQVVIRSLEDSLPVDFACVCLHDPVANALSVARVGVKSAPLAHELTLDETDTISIDANGLARCVQGQLVYEPDIVAVPFPFPQRLARGGLGSVVMAPLKSESLVFGVLIAARQAANAFSSIECEFLRQLSEHVALAAHHAQLYGALQQAYDELRQTQHAAMQEERLRALGQMASGIAHDINNALSPVSLYTESMLDTERHLSDRSRGYLKTIQRAVEDVSQTVARLREFYRTREAQLELTPVQVNEMVQQVVDLTKARWFDMPQQSGIVIHMATALASDLPKVMGVESEIRESLTNLVFNAVDAMPEGGTLTLRTGVTDTGGQANVMVEVSDTGVGMDEETRRRCLEPFFSTKGERGTGLGLAMVFGMVQRHSADIEIESDRGHGTTVRLIFTVTSAVQMGTDAPVVAPHVPERLRLLLIDDDPIILKSLGDALEADGHVIVTANGGEAGIAAFRLPVAGAAEFDAVITDLGMPYVDGRRVATAVKEASHTTPVIMLTGWGQRLVAEGDTPPHVDRVLAKPPKLRELRQALAELCQPKTR